MNQEKIGKFIAKIRKEKTMTQAQLADKLNVTDHAVGNWENGRRLPDYSIIKDLCDELGITINEFFAGEKIKNNDYAQISNENLNSILKEYHKMKKQKNMIIIVLGCLGVFLLQGLLLFLFLYLSFTTAKAEINTNINKYNDYIGDSAKEEYRNKWGMKEEIFPNKIDSNMNIVDYKTVYYNPWDAQYLSYLVIKYNDEDYNKEIERLNKYKSTDYIGYYNVTGFSKYTLLAMEADSYNGFIYAITDNQNTIIYVEIIFCNYFMDLEYEEYIDINYLPDGFDATLNNNYSQKMIKSK